MPALSFFGKRPTSFKRLLRRIHVPLIVLFSCSLNACWTSRIANPLTPAQVNKSDYGRNAKLLYYMDLGITNHYEGRYAVSNRKLEDAERLGEQLYTKSLTGTAASFIVNDYVLAYRGEDFELALIHLYMALNYAKLDKLEDALVEARKLDSKLSALNQSYPEGKKNVYKEDALIRFIAALLHEMEGNLDSANVDYMKSLEVFKDYAANYGTVAPRFVVENLLTVADGAGFPDRVEKLRSEYPDAQFLRYKSKQRLGEVIVVHYHGKSPVKVSERVPLGIMEGVVLTVSFPKYEYSPRNREGATVTFTRADGKGVSCTTEVMENIEAIARKNLKNRIHRMNAKAIARLAAQYTLIETQAKKIRKKYGENSERLWRMTTHLSRELASTADTRSCRSLPAEIRIGRAILMPGEYSANIRMPDGETRQMKKLKVSAGKKEFVILRSVD
ncbi:MAG: hypothetical protein QF473_17940 [Planctomycetota bacterium]|nr:hypothetical protein [Planctomycetota bacterium]